MVYAVVSVYEYIQCLITWQGVLNVASIIDKTFILNHWVWRISWLWANFRSIHYNEISGFFFVFLFLNVCSQCSHETCKAWVKVFIIFMCMIFVFFLRCFCLLFCYVTRHADIVIRITLFPIVYIRVTSPTVTSRVNEAIVNYQKKVIYNVIHEISWLI